MYVCGHFRLLSFIFQTTHGTGEISLATNLVALFELHSLRTNIDFCVDEFDSLMNQIKFSGNKITINGDFVRRFPVLEHETTYRRIGMQVKSLTVSNVLLEQANNICPFFTNLETLIVEGLEIVTEECKFVFPSGVRYLKFSKCLLVHPVTPDSLMSMKDTLETLHFDQVRSLCTPMMSMHLFYFQYPLVALRHLIFERLDTRIFLYLFELYGRNLESLKYVNTFGSICFANLRSMPKLKRLEILDCRHFPFPPEIPVDAPKLEFVSIRGTNPNHFRLCLGSDPHLKTLDFQTNTEFSDLQRVLKMKKLEYVRIHCNWRHAEQLKEHFASLEGMKSYEVTCCPPTPGYSLQNSLNNDCLQKVFSYLSKKELHNMTFVHPKFISVISWVILDEDFLADHPPENIEFYQEIGSQVTRLDAKAITPSEFNQIIPHFQNLSALKMVNIAYPERWDLSEEEEENNSDEIRAVEQSLSETESAEWISFFRRINPNLKCFEFFGYRSDTIIKCLNELHNLEHFASHRHDSGFKEQDYAFLNQNKMLIHLKVPYIKDTKVISNKDSLRTLIIDFPEELKISHARQLNRFTNLECLGIAADKKFTKFLNELNLVHLKCVKLRVFDMERTMLTWIKHFRAVDRLELDFYGGRDDIPLLETNLRLMVELSKGVLGFNVKRIGEQVFLFTRP